MARLYGPLIILNILRLACSRTRCDLVLVCARIASLKVKRAILPLAPPPEFDLSLPRSISRRAPRAKRILREQELSRDSPRFAEIGQFVSVTQKQ